MSLTQTAANAAALHALGARHPWLEGADAFLWARIDGLDLGRAEPTPGLAHDVRFSIGFLDAVPDEARAIAALTRWRPAGAPPASSPASGAATSGRRSTSRPGRAPAAGGCSRAGSWKATSTRRV